MPKARKLVPLEYTLDPYLLRIFYLLGFVLLGKGLLHFTATPPYAAILQNENLCKPLVEFMGYSWTWYVQSSQAESILLSFNWFMGTLFLSSILIIMIFLVSINRILKRKRPTENELDQIDSKAIRDQNSNSTQSLIGTQKKQFQQMGQRRLTEAPKILSIIQALLLFIFGLQLFYAVSYYFDHSFYMVIFLEQSLPCILPLMLYLLLPYTRYRDITWAHLARWSLSFVFLGHGLFAISYYDTPDDYLIMSMNILSISEGNAYQMLKIIGWIDIICAVLIHLPIRGLKIKNDMSEDRFIGAQRPDDEINHKHKGDAINLSQIYHYPLWKRIYLAIIDQLKGLYTLWIIKQKSIRYLALSYMMIWGICTACARIFGHATDASMIDLFKFWIPTCIIRLPHGLLAYLLICYDRDHD
jgi:hypothetical protein